MSKGKIEPCKDRMPVAQQVNILFEVLLRSDGKPYSVLDLSIKAGMSTGTISRLRTGGIENPGIWTLQKVCDFFGIPLAYFDCKSPEECRAFLLQHTAKEYKSPTLIYFLRSQGLSDKGVNHILDAISYIRASEEKTRASTR